MIRYSLQSAFTGVASAIRTPKTPFLHVCLISISFDINVFFRKYIVKSDIFVYILYSNKQLTCLYVCDIYISLLLLFVVSVKQ